MSRADVEWALQAHLVPAQLVAFSPISTWVLGLSRDKLLKRMDLSEHHVSSATPILLCIWGFVALAFFLTVASFLGYALSASRVALVLLTVFLAAVAIAASVSSAVRRKKAGAAERPTASPHDDLPWIPDIPLDRLLPGVAFRDGLKAFASTTQLAESETVDRCNQCSEEKHRHAGGWHDHVGPSDRWKKLGSDH